MYFKLCDKISFFFFLRQNSQVKIEFGTPGFLDPRARLRIQELLHENRRAFVTI